MYSFQAIQILIFLIPGFISEALLNQFVFRKDKSELWTIVEALIFSLIIYTIYSLVISKSPVELTVINSPNESTSSTYTYNSVAFLWLVAFSVIIPIILSYLLTYDVYMKLLRFLHISKRTTRESTWLDVFSDYQSYIIVNFSDGRRIMGWPRYYSDDPDSQYIYLYEPALIVPNRKTKKDEYQYLNTAEGILITPEQKIESIVFLKNE